MSILKIAQLGHPVLRQSAVEVSLEELKSTETQRLIDDMKDTLADSGGVGLSAPQVFESKRIAIVQVTTPNPWYPDRAMIPFTVLINPQVTSYSDQIVEGWEGCLSALPVYGLVPRSVRIDVRALDRRGASVEFEAVDFYARVIQHEVDHLNGLLFIDRMRNFDSLCFEAERKRYWDGKGICPPSIPAS